MSDYSSLNQRQLQVLNSIYQGALRASGNPYFAAGLTAQGYYEKFDSNFNPMRIEDTSRGLAAASYGIFNTGQGVWNAWVQFAKDNGIDYKSSSSAGDYAEFITNYFGRVAPTAAGNAFSATSVSDALSAYRTWNYGGNPNRAGFGEEFLKNLPALTGEQRTAPAALDPTQLNEMVSGALGFDPTAFVDPGPVRTLNLGDVHLPVVDFATPPPAPTNPAPREEAGPTPVDTFNRFSNPVPSEEQFTPLDWFPNNPAPTEEIGPAPVDTFNRLSNPVPNLEQFTPLDWFPNNPAPTEEIGPAPVDTFNRLFNPVPSEEQFTPVDFQPLDQSGSMSPISHDLEQFGADVSLGPDVTEPDYTNTLLGLGGTNTGNQTEALADWNAANEEFGAGNWYYNSEGDVVGMPKDFGELIRPPDLPEAQPLDQQATGSMSDRYAGNIVGRDPVTGEPIYGSTALDNYRVAGIDPATGQPIYASQALGLPKNYTPFSKPGVGPQYSAMSSPWNTGQPFTAGYFVDANGYFVAGMPNAYGGIQNDSHVGMSMHPSGSADSGASPPGGWGSLAVPRSDFWIGMGPAGKSLKGKGG